jgi:plastocyanin
MSIRSSIALPIAAGALLALPSTAQQFVFQNGAIPGANRWTEGVESADVDNDGDLDIFFAEGEGFSSAGTKRQNILIINRLEIAGGLVDESVARLGVHLSNAKGVDTGDIQGDGYVDALFANAFNTDLPFLYVNQGAGNPGFFNFEGPARGFNTIYSSGASNFGDLDNDGDLDVIICDSGNSYLGGSGDRPHLYFNDGNGNFTENAAALGAPIKAAHMDVQYADIDQDWDLDFIGFNRNSNGGVPHYLMLNDGSGNFTDASALQQNSSGNVYEGEVGDLDGDTDMDWFLVSLNGFNDGPVRNNFIPTGSISFTNGNAISGSDDNEIVLLDYDNDGDYDSIVGSLAGTEKMLRNNGLGGFNVQGGTFTSISDSTLDATAADIDNDGDYDVITAQGESNSAQWNNKLYLNNGSKDTRAPVIVREETVVAASASPWVIRSQVRDQVMDDGVSYVSAEVDYVVNSAPQTAAVGMVGLTFSPASLVVAPGTTVTWTNTGGPGSMHTVTSSTPGYDFDSGTLSNGQTFSYTFVRPGTYDYFCTPHVSFGMTGQIIVSAGATNAKGFDMGGGGMYRFEMTDASGGTELVYERRFTDWAGNVTVSPAQTVAVGGGGPTGFMVYGTGSSPANYMSINGTGNTQPGGAFTVTTTGVTQAGVLLVISLNQTNTPLLGGIMLADYFSQLFPAPFLPAAGGVSTYNNSVPNNPGLVGLNVYFQSGISDLSQPGGVGLSDGLKLTVL